MRNTILFLLLLGGCVPPSIAEKATYNAIAPAHRAYVEADTSLDVQQKQRRFDLLATWRIAVGLDK